MQNEVCRNCAQSGISQTVVTVNGAPKCCCCGTSEPATIAPREWGESKDAFVLRAFGVGSETVEAAPDKKGRCSHYPVIREFASIARENGLSMADKDRARGAMGVYLGVKINSRADLSAAQWRSAITGLRAGVLFW